MGSESCDFECAFVHRLDRALDFIRVTVIFRVCHQNSWELSGLWLAEQKMDVTELIHFLLFVLVLELLILVFP